MRRLLRDADVFVTNVRPRRWSGPGCHTPT